MKKLLLIVLVPFLSFAQDANLVTGYYPHTSKAELFIIDQNYAEAIAQYDSAFAASPKYFVRDAYNAAVSAVLAGNADAGYKFLKLCAAKGLSLDFVKEEFAFASIQKDTKWAGFEQEYQAAKKIADSKVNKDLKAQLEKLAEDDGKYRQGNMIFNADSTKILDKQNALALEGIIKKYGFPDEDLIGIGDGGTPLLQYGFYNVLRHQSGDDLTVNFSNQILTAIRQGKISPHIAVNILGTITGSDSFFSRHVFKITTGAQELFTEPYADKLNQWVHRQLTAEEEAPFNTLRQQNGMENMADYRRKIKFSIENQQFLFPYKIFAGIWEVNENAAAEKFLDGTVILN